MSNDSPMFGARYVQPGFAFDETHDLLFALGWPHRVQLIEVDPLDKDPGKSTSDIWQNLLAGRSGPDGDIDRRLWPRGIASNVARIFASPAGTFYGPATLTWAPTPMGKKLLDKGPMDRPEASRLLQAATTSKAIVPDTFIDLVLVLEALVGTNVILDDLVDLLESWTTTTWKSANLTRYAVVYQLANLLLRTTSAHASSLQNRLLAIQENKAGGIPPQRDRTEPCCASRALDVVIHGAVGARRSALPVATPASTFWELRYVPNDRAYVAERFCREKRPGEAKPDARLVFLGGSKVLDHQAGWWSKYKGGVHTQRTYVRTYGAIKAPQIVTIFAEMFVRSKVKTEVKAWFLKHREYAADILQQTEQNEATKAALALIG